MLKVFCAGSTLLVTERLAQQLRLPQRSRTFTINGVAGFNVRQGKLWASRFQKYEVRGGSRLRWKPLSFPRSLLTYPQFQFLQLPNGNICWGWSLLTQITEHQHGWTSLLERKSLARQLQSSMARSSVPLEHHQCSRHASARHWMEKWKEMVVCCVTLDDNSLRRF